ncbi:tellurite resistance domain protein [Rahnella sp. AA]|uniref:tellurite resistance domain protein n=1 Tax=Rahnella sp. AA TaxID=2057180 RepID=UPI000C326A28|nr:tellurite resistance domain protein [Rahnella sp. AA]PKE32026.1 tellurite resistance domain protein [Rahnella sp. AA]
MQRLTSAAPIDDSTLATYEETVAIIHRHLPPSLALLYATARRGFEGNLEWWTARQGLAKPLSSLSEAEQLTVQNKRQQYQGILAGLIEQLAARGEEKSAHALQMLLTHSQGLTCYGVAGEPVLINWAIPSQALPAQQTPHFAATLPSRRRIWPWLLLLLLLLLLALAWWGYKHLAPPTPAPATPVAVAPAAPTQAGTQLTQDNPSINLAKRKDFGRIKVNLTWQQHAQQYPIDLDIAAFVRFKNGEKSAIEALSKYFGDYEKPPYMMLQKDLRDGDDQDGEWLFINGSNWQDIDEVLIYSFIYGGADNWQGTNATITLYIPDQPPISSTLTDGNERNNVAAIARLKNVDGDIKVERLNNFFRDRESLDKHFGWGFKWTPGASKN